MAAIKHVSLVTGNEIRERIMFPVILIRARSTLYSAGTANRKYSTYQCFQEDEARKDPGKRDIDENK